MLVKALGDWRTLGVTFATMGFIPDYFLRVLRVDAVIFLGVLRVLGGEA